ncbi:MAG: response regulator [Xanthobacteraceae bacterium]
MDDSTSVCHLVGNLLRQCGFKHIDLVKTGSEALERLAAAKYDAIVCDWEIQPISGLDVLNHVRRRADLRETPFILMSAKRDPHWIAEALRLGANCMITKPFDAAALQEKFRQVGFSLKSAPSASPAPTSGGYHVLDF